MGIWNDDLGTKCGYLKNRLLTLRLIMELKLKRE